MKNRGNNVFINEKIVTLHNCKKKSNNKYQ